MNIIFICSVFPPEPEPSATMAHQLACRLARDGHTVTVIGPFPNRPDGLLSRRISPPPSHDRS